MGTFSLPSHELNWWCRATPYRQRPRVRLRAAQAAISLNRQDRTCRPWDGGGPRAREWPGWTRLNETTCALDQIK
jgi:hypothetical protein